MKDYQRIHLKPKFSKKGT